MSIGTFRGACGREWEEELPPLWAGLDLWPECCGEPALLVDVERTPEEWTRTTKFTPYSEFSYRVRSGNSRLASVVALLAYKTLPLTLWVPALLFFG